LFTGLAVMIAIRAGLWNIGAEGQLLLGALATAWVGQYLTAFPTPLAIAIVVAVSLSVRSYSKKRAGIVARQWTSAPKGNCRCFPGPIISGTHL
jgi:simple sugar transport system permease protein